MKIPSPTEIQTRIHAVKMLQVNELLGHATRALRSATRLPITVDVAQGQADGVIDAVTNALRDAGWSVAYSDAQLTIDADRNDDPTGY